MSEKERSFPLKADISDEDIIEAMKEISGYLDITPGDFKEIMTSPAITVFENTTVSEIAGIFSEKNINRVPVTDSAGNLIGIVSRADLLRYLPFREK